MTTAIACDHLRIALAHVGQISERRMSHLWDAFFEQEAGAGVPPPGWEPPELFGLSLRYPAAATFSELKQLAAPATLDAPPLDIGIEDHATSAPLTARKTGEALDLLEEILSIEVLMASDVLGGEQPAPMLGERTSTVIERARQTIGALEEDRSPAHVQRSVAAALFAPSVDTS